MSSPEGGYDWDDQREGVDWENHPLTRFVFQGWVVIIIIVLGVGMGAGLADLSTNLFSSGDQSEKEAAPAAVQAEAEPEEPDPLNGLLARLPTPKIKPAEIALAAADEEEDGEEGEDVALDEDASEDGESEVAEASDAEDTGEEAEVADAGDAPDGAEDGDAVQEDGADGTSEPVSAVAEAETEESEAEAIDVAASDEDATDEPLAPARTAFMGPPPRSGPPPGSRRIVSAQARSEPAQDSSTDLPESQVEPKTQVAMLSPDAEPDADNHTAVAIRAAKLAEAEEALERARREAEARKLAEKKAAAEAKARAEAAEEAKRLAEAKKFAEAKAAAEAKARAEAAEEARRLAEAKRVAEAKAAAEAKARLEAAEEAKRLEEARQLAEAKAAAESKARAQAAAKAKRLEEARQVAEAKAAAEAKARAQAAEQAKRLEEARQVAEAKAAAEAKARVEASEEAKRLAEAKNLAEAKAAAESEALAQIEEEARQLAEAKRLAEVKAAAEAKARAEAEVELRRLAEAKARAEQRAMIEAQARVKAEAEARRLAEAKKLAEVKAAQAEAARAEAARAEAAKAQLARQAALAKAAAEQAAKAAARKPETAPRTGQQIVVAGVNPATRPVPAPQRVIPAPAVKCYNALSRVNADGTPRKPVISVIIDDLGLNPTRTRGVINLKGPLTLAMLPYGRELQALSNEARAKGHDVMVHMPMEPYEKDNPGPHALYRNLDGNEIDRRFNWAMSQFDGYVGFNNHMGSAMTSDRTGMARVMQNAKGRGVFFIDSVTSQKTVALAMARGYGIRSIRRDVFLDHYRTAENVKEQLKRLESVARRKGTAVGIGHPHSVTVAALKPWLATVEQRGFKLVRASTVVDMYCPRGGGAAQAPMVRMPATGSPAPVLSDASQGGN